MDLVEWELIRDADSTVHWVMECHVLGYDPATSQIRAKLLVALYGPYTPEQVRRWEHGADILPLIDAPCYRDLEAAERRPPVYEVVAHLHDEVLEPPEGGTADATRTTTQP
jgi:hypothetical protein